MVRRYSFLFCFLGFVGSTGVVVWACRSPAPPLPNGLANPAPERRARSPSPAGPAMERSASPRRHLPAPRADREVLDRLVAYEHYYRSVYGHFTKLVSRLGYPVLGDLAEISMMSTFLARASRERLVITAFSEVDGRTLDLRLHRSGLRGASQLRSACPEARISQVPGLQTATASAGLACGPILRGTRGFQGLLPF